MDTADTTQEYPTDPEQRFEMINRPQHRIPGHNVDAVDVDAGMAELDEIGVFTTETRTVITYALQRHARGEEAAAQRSAIDTTFHGIDLTGWYRVLAAARAGGSEALEEASAPTHPTETTTRTTEGTATMSNATITVANSEFHELLGKLRDALRASADAETVEALIKNDEDGEPYVFIEQKLPSRVYAEVEDNTYGRLRGFRLYIND